MSIFLTLAYLFFIGALSGWVIELLFRRFISKKNPQRKWLNPGFCVGPYLPLYGCGLCVMYSLCSCISGLVPEGVGGIVLMLAVMTLAMDLLEFIAGICMLKLSHVRLWDYTSEWGNIKGIICPKFTLIWAGCSAIYYFLVHPYILDALHWLSENLAFSFVIGMFFGVFIIDVVYSTQLIAKIRRFALDNEVEIAYESFKAQVRQAQEEAKEKINFLFPFRSQRQLFEHLKAAQERLENYRNRDNKGAGK